MKLSYFFLQKIESHLKNREFSSMHSVEEFTMFVQFIHCLRCVVLMNEYTEETDRKRHIIAIIYKEVGSSNNQNQYLCYAMLQCVDVQ